MKPALSPIWKLGVRRMRSICDRPETAEQKLHRCQAENLFCIQGDSKEAIERSVDCWEDYILHRWGLLGARLLQQGESIHTNPSVCVSRDGVRYSADFGKKVNLAAYCLSGGRCETVLEIGAGWGQVARIILNAQPATKYVIVDLPESLFFSRTFLRLNFPGAAIRSDLHGPWDILLLTPEQFYENLVGLPEFDVFLNSSSLGEMSGPVAEGYIEAIQHRLEVRRVVLLNRLLNGINPWKEWFRTSEASRWYWALDSRWKVTEWELEPCFTRFTPVELAHNRELIFCAERSGDLCWTSPAIGDFTFAKGTHNRLHNRLVVETGRSSTLCGLCEAARTNPYYRKAQTDLINYLKGFGREFEEMPFLTRRLNAISETADLVTSIKWLAFSATSAVHNRLYDGAIRLGLIDPNRYV